MTANPQPGSPSTPARSAAPTSRGAGPLVTTVRVGLTMLSDLRNLHPGVTSGGLEHSLRGEIERIGREGTASGVEAALVAAVRTACAHLACRAWEDAYLALVVARGLVPPRDQR